MHTYYNGESLDVSDLRANFPNVENSDYQLQNMYNSKKMALNTMNVSDMNKTEIAQKMANSMQNNNAIHYEFKTSKVEAHAVGVVRVRIYDNGRIMVNFMNPSGMGGYNTTNFNKMTNIFTVRKF